MAAPYLVIDIDGTEVQGLLMHMAACLTPPKFDGLMRRSLSELGKRSKKPIREAIQGQYFASTSWVNSSIRSAKIEGGGGNILCIIPVISGKGQIGGQFAAAGGAKGWNPPAYRVTAQIVKDGPSVLPTHMTHQGGQPPFRNLGSKTTTRTVIDKQGKRKTYKIKRKGQNPDKFTKNGKKGTGFMTRAGKGRLPIEPMSGIAVPQMPLNRAAAQTTDSLLSIAQSRVMHNFAYLFY